MTSKALVLGGGGPVGIAWESGLLAGFAKAGVDLGRADYILGTSAGSFVGARLALGAETASLAEPILTETQRPARRAEDRPTRPAADLSTLMRLMADAQSGLGNPAEGRARIGAFAREAQTMGEEAFLQSFGRSFSSLLDDTWPERGFACTAVDAETGAFQLWTKADGVPVTRAVASSCSVPGVYPPVTVAGRRWIDGGMRSPTNADLAAGHDIVVVIAIRVGGSEMGDRLAAQLEQEVGSLKDGGATVILITPDDASQAAMGANLMDFAQRPDAARAGLAQGAAQAEALAAAWDA